jgi:serine/threonine protein kinase
LNPRDGVVLTWEQRFNILKGVASGLLYLHEDWEQVVVHRDIKSSNVLIDSELNGKLGDFGLARLYDHGQRNSQTTSVVGTIGYIAPELIQTGKASTCSDVFAFGVLLLEVFCGRGPVVRDEDGEHTVLVDWVIRCVKTGQILDPVDPRLGENYVKVEVEVVLCLGLLCSHSRPEARPTMRQIVKYLDGDEKLNVFHNMDSIDSSRQMDEITSRFLERVSSDVNTSSSFSTFSIGDICSTSLKGGR